ncbi:MAG: hypothetical protein JJU05_05645 [Verrucomicrobia bacterium]|nr:hypothetical protein [Verrucomicrobiota bacterium]MCH8525622.1 hypothetical protein [Kiritimatiellia bacterium]
MDFRIDMIHHNPGEPAFDSAFSDPGYLKACGYTGQAFKHINTVLTFEAVAPGVFPGTVEEARWLEDSRARIRGEIADAKAAGLSVFYHIDLFVLPRRILERFGDRLRDPDTGRVSVDQPFTLELHRAMFEELFRDFPEVDGLIIRVGETYLFDTPYHAGNGAVHYSTDNPEENKVRQFVRLLNFLREAVCEKHGKILIHRTWDTWPNRFHANLDFYLRVTDAVPPHPKLIFSVKHTQVDFHRWVEFNPCLMRGNHPQVVEVQCQREYEGKGAYPNYIARGVIEGFPEQREPKGLRDIQDDPLFAGMYTWSRGGGWYGPAVDRHNELWCDLNARVLMQWARDPARSEEAVFMEVAKEGYGISTRDAEVFRRIALGSCKAVLKGKCCEVYDRREKEHPGYPTNQWMRDDVLQGFERLGPVFDYLLEAGGVEEALREKAESASRWRAMREDCQGFSPGLDANLRQVILTSVEHGLRFFTAIEAAWRALLPGWCLKQGGGADRGAMERALCDFDRAWARYEALPEEYPRCASLYRLHGWAWPDQTPPPGLSGALDEIRSLLREPAAV